MRVIVAWAALLIASGAFIAMLWVSCHQPSAATGDRRNTVELAWSMIPWVIVVLSATPAMIRLAVISGASAPD